MEILNSGEIINLLLVLAIAAAVAGFMAGLLGVGGGIIMVPALYYAFTVLDFDIVTRMHLSVGTSLAIIIPTSIISTKTHMEYDAVDFKMVKSFGIFILLGVIAGTFLAVNLKTPMLVLFFSPGKYHEGFMDDEAVPAHVVADAALRVGNGLLYPIAFVGFQRIDRLLQYSRW